MGLDTKKSTNLEEEYDDDVLLWKTQTCPKPDVNGLVTMKMMW